MEKLSLLQDYLVKKLIEDKLLDVDNLIKVISKICSEEQFNSILNELIPPIPEPAEKKLGDETVIVGMRTINNKKLTNQDKLNAIKILQQYYNTELYKVKDLIDKICEGGDVRILNPIKLKNIDTLVSELWKCGINAYY